MSGKKVVSAESTQVDRPFHVAICVPSTDVVQSFFAYDLARMMTTTALQRPDIKLQLIFTTGSLIQKLRESLVRVVVEQTEATHLLFLDSDMRFPKQTLLQLLSHGLPAVCGGYTERVPPYRPTAFLTHDDYSKRAWPTEDATGLLEIAASGFGCMLLTREALEAVPIPRFMVGYSRNMQAYIGEDIYFCMQLRGAGIPLMLDQDLTKEIGHIGRMEYRFEHALQARAATEAAADAARPKLIKEA